jgi:hypothetical protein
MIYTKNKLITLNSKYGIQQNGTYKSNLLFNFKNLLSDEQHMLKSEVIVLNAQIPVSFYVINEYNNVLTISGPGILTTSITCDTGNYNANTLITELKSQFTTAGVLFTNIKINKNSGKLVFTATSTTNYSFSGSMLDVIGSTSSTTSTSNIYKCIYPLNLLGVQKLSIKSEKLAVQTASSVDYSFSNTLVTIPVDVSPFSMISYTSQSDANKNLLNVRTINEIDIQVYDENNNLVNFNNLDWNITLIITTDIKYDQQEISLNTLLKNNYLDLKEPVEDLNDRLIEDIKNRDNNKNNTIDPKKIQQQKELDILNY